MTVPGRPGTTPQLLERAFALLAIFDEDRPEWTTTEAAHEVGLPVPTAHRILGVLEREGFLSRDGDKRFTLGSASLDLGRRALPPADRCAHR
jgi:DNA-binding IclR family transcriptional regulator